MSGHNQRPPAFSPVRPANLPEYAARNRFASEFARGKKLPIKEIKNEVHALFPDATVTQKDSGTYVTKRSVDPRDPSRVLETVFSAHTPRPSGPSFAAPNTIGQFHAKTYTLLPNGTRVPYTASRAVAHRNGIGGIEFEQRAPKLGYKFGPPRLGSHSTNIQIGLTAAMGEAFSRARDAPSDPYRRNPHPLSGKRGGSRRRAGRPAIRRTKTRKTRK